MEVSGCFLQSLGNAKKIPLPHDVPVIIGRNRYSGIKDKIVSRKQLLLRANCITKSVSVKSCGVNASACNGCLLTLNKEYTLVNGDVLELVMGMHRYEICFESKSEPEKKQQNQCEGLLPVLPWRRDYGPGIWELLDHNRMAIYSSHDIVSKNKIAAFGMDGVILSFETGTTLYCPLRQSSIRELFDYLHGEDYKIAIFGNRLDFEDRLKLDQFMHRMACFFNTFVTPVQLFVALKTSCYRKPRIGLWRTLRDMKNDLVGVDRARSFYIGSTREEQKQNPQFDQQFAANIGLYFFEVDSYMRTYATIARYMRYKPKRKPRTAVSLFPDHQEVILMVGGPSTGKTSYCKKHIVPRGYVHVSGDRLVTWRNCAKKAEEALREKNSVVVDCPNGTVNDRKRYIDLAQRYNVPCRCFLMRSSLKHSAHNNKFRGLVDRKYVPLSKSEIVSNWSRFQKPTVEEGFDEIVSIGVVPQDTGKVV